MSDTKMVKARCRATNKYFGLEVKQVGREYKVVDFIPLSTEESALLCSEVKQSSFYTNDNLIPCQKCGSRKIGGCAHIKDSKSCSVPYNFQCAYCSQLQIDYSVPKRVAGRRDGELITLTQGQVVKISFANDEPLTELYVHLGWDPAVQGENIDVDSSVVVKGSSGYELVYFVEKEHPSGCVVHHGDNLTGVDRGGNLDDENISIYLDEVPKNRDEIYFVLNIYKCSERCQKFGQIQNMYIRISDIKTRKPLIEYKMDRNYGNYTALIIGRAFRTGNEWSFEAIGKGSYAKDIYQLVGEIKNQ
ncbi:MAG: TerD family protein [Clostridia bacterium]|nr:TerD family protein [Clostridia bacterium]